MKFYIDFLESLIDALKLEGVSLVGISLGGGAALGFALRSSQRVRGWCWWTATAWETKFPGTA